MEENNPLPTNPTLRQIAARIVESKTHHVALLAIPDSSGECVIYMTQDEKNLGKSPEEITKLINKTIEAYNE